VVNNNYPQITSVTSESLQAQIRTLLPSQEGFGTDLMAQNVIVPIIDLTAAAEGSSVPQMLQTALSFGSQTEFETSGGTATIANTTGFYRIVGSSTVVISGADQRNTIRLTNGLANKEVWGHAVKDYSSWVTSLDFDLVVFLTAGDSCLAISSYSENVIIGSVRQIADVNGVLVNPSGFNPQ